MRSLAGYIGTWQTVVTRWPDATDAGEVQLGQIRFQPLNLFWENPAFPLDEDPVKF